MPSCLQLLLAVVLQLGVGLRGGGRLVAGWSTALPSGCSVKPLGCIQDCGGSGDLKHRILPFCAGSAGHSDCGLGCPPAPGTERPPDDPPCDTSKMTPEYCAAICHVYMAGATGYAGRAYAGTQAGTQCWCGLVQPSTVTRLPASSCSSVCPGDASQKCGASCLSSAVEVDCTSSFFGWPLVGLLVVGAGAYLGGGAALNYSKGARGLQQLLPHRELWLEVVGLATDGCRFVQRGRPGGGGGDGKKARRSGNGKSTSGGLLYSEQQSAQSNSPKMKRTNKEKEKKEKASRMPASSHPSAERLPAAGTNAPAAAVGTPAGGGGRWVHVPA
eukprot:SAG31_NODE_748_length_12390_cov_6.306484_10_plen_329_part_00